MDSNSGDEEFEGFVLSPEEKASYKFWRRRKALTSNALNSDSDEDTDADDDDDEDEDEDHEESDDSDDRDDEQEIEDSMDPFDDVTIQNSGDELSCGNSEQCPVCLMSLKEQLLGTPNNCPHVFCFECIREWAKNATTCPVGRLPFTEILVHATKKGPILQRIQVEQRMATEEEEEDDPTSCEVCGGFDREDRMLLCDVCDNGYHMECLTPPVEFVPMDEWYCPACASCVDTDEDDLERRALVDSEPHSVLESSLTRALQVACERPQRRPRGGTARHDAISGRTGTPRTARTVASTRASSGRGRRRGTSRGRGPGQKRSSSTKRKSSAKKRKRKSTAAGRSSKDRGPKKKKKVNKRTKKGKQKITKKRRITEEDEVSPFIYEPKRRGKTVHARLLESLNSTGRSSDIGRSSLSSSSMARAPFPSRVEPSCSFSLFGNAYALHDFDEGDDHASPTSERGDQGSSSWTSSQSNNPDVLGSIFEGLDTLYDANPQVSRDGRLVVASDKSRDVVKHSQTKLTVSEENEKNCGGVPKMKEETTEQKLAVVESKMVSEAENPKPSFSSQNKLDNCKELSRPKNTSESISFSTSEFHASCSKAKETERLQQTSSTSGIPSKLSESLPTLSGFRIPKRRSYFESEKSKKVATTDNANDTVNKESDRSVPLLSKFKIPKKVKSKSDDRRLQEKSSHVGTVELSKTELSTGLNSAGGSKHKLRSSHLSSIYPEENCRTTAPKVLQGSFLNSSIVRPRENFERKQSHSVSDPKAEISVACSTGKTACYANSINVSVSRNISASNISRLGAALHKCSSGEACTALTRSNDVTKCHATESVIGSNTVTASTSNVAFREVTGRAVHFSNNLLTRRPRSLSHSSASSSRSLEPPPRVTPLIDRAKTTIGGKEQRLSNIEIIKRLQEKQRSIREQILSDPIKKDAFSLGSETELRSPSRERFVTCATSPSCSHGTNLPVAVVKPQNSCVVVTASIIVSPSEEIAPAKSIASGIIDVHTSNAEELMKVHKESNPESSKVKTVGQKVEPRLTGGAIGDRQQQRKMGIARLQRQQQIVDEVKLALKPFFKRGEVSKDEYKLIMKKSVDKIKESSSSVDRERVVRLIKKYVKKIKNANVNASTSS